MKKLETKQHFLPFSDSFRTTLKETGMFVGFVKQVEMLKPEDVKAILHPKKEKQKKDYSKYNQAFLLTLILAIMLFILLKL